MIETIVYSLLIFGTGLLLLSIIFMMYEIKQIRQDSHILDQIGEYRKIAMEIVEVSMRAENKAELERCLGQMNQVEKHLKDNKERAYTEDIKEHIDDNIDWVQDGKEMIEMIIDSVEED